MNRFHIWALALFSAMVLGLGVIATVGANPEPKLYFATIALLIVIGVIALLSALASRAEDDLQKLYFGVIGTLVGSVVGLTGGLLGGQAAADQTTEKTDQVQDTTNQVQNQVRELEETVKEAQPK